MKINFIFLIAVTAFLVTGYFGYFEKIADRVDAAEEKIEVLERQVASMSQYIDEITDYNQDEESDREHGNISSMFGRSGEDAQ